MRGRSISLSRPRRLVADLMHVSMRVPRVTVQREMELGPLLEARARLERRPSWAAIFLKAYALLALETPALRRAYVKLPWPKLYEYPGSIASVAYERDIDGERAVLLHRMRQPEGRPLGDIEATMREVGAKPVDEIKDFRRALAFAGLPLPVRRALMWLGLNIGRQRANHFGTFQVSVYSALGAESLNPLTPLTSLMNYGRIGPEGRVTVRIHYDHRVVDGAEVARALARLETILNGPLLDELKGFR